MSNSKTRVQNPFQPWTCSGQQKPHDCSDQSSEHLTFWAVTRWIHWSWSAKFPSGLHKKPASIVLLQLTLKFAKRIKRSHWSNMTASTSSLTYQQYHTESSRLPHKSSPSCHVRCSGAPSVPVRRQASADIYGGTESTTPAKQIQAEAPILACHANRQPDVPTVPACHANPEVSTPATQIEPEVLKASRTAT